MGQAALVTSPATTIVKQSLDNKYDINKDKMIPVNLFSRYYQKSEQDFLKLINEGNNVFKNLNINIKEARNFYKNNKELANFIIEMANNKFAKRGFWGHIGDFFKNVGKTIKDAAKTVGHVVATIGGAVASGVTFGQLML